MTLTAYFAERERLGGRFLADELLDLYERRGVAASVMLRGIASFGPAHVVRSDRSLSLSEDPPVTLTALDTPDRVTQLAGEVAPVLGRGVLTLERGRAGDTAAPPDGDVRLSVYLGRRQRIAGAPGYVALCEVLHQLGFASAEVYLGVDGTVRGQRRRARFFSRNIDVPLVVVGVGSAAQAASAVAELAPRLTDPLITTEPVLVCKNAGRTLADVTTLPGAFLKLTVRTDEDSRYRGTPVHRALVRRLMAAEHANGATVLRSIWGYHGDQAPHGDRFAQLARHVPVSTVVVDTAESIASSYAVVDELTATHGLVTCESVPAVLAVDDGRIMGGLELD